VPIDRSGWTLAIAAVAAASCGGRNGVPSVPTTTGPPEVTFVASDDNTVRFVRVGATTIVVTRTVTVPGLIAELVWVGREPVVMLDDGEVGHISASGYEPFPRVPESLWTIAEPDAQSLHLDTPLWQLIGDTAGVAWQARCDWGLGKLKNGDVACDAWLYARVPASPTTISRTQPTAAPALAFPDVAPSSRITAEIVSAPADAPDVPGKPILRCTAAGTTSDFPPADQRFDVGRYAFVGVDDLVWLATEPPMFRITVAVASQRIDLVFDGCDVSTAFGHAHVTAGPHEVVAIFTDQKLSVRRHGREIGTLDDVRIVRFAPAP
jgi:hypothetical protein